MRKSLLLAALLLSAGITASAQTVADAWTVNTAQTFNKVGGQFVTTTPGADGSLTISFPQTEAGKLGRVEIASATAGDIAFGQGRKVMVMKLSFEGCTFADYQVNFNLMRQLYKGSDNKGEKIEPYLSPNANAMAGRYNNGKGDTSTTGYYYRDLSGVYNSATNGIADFEGDGWQIPGGHFTNGKFTFNGENTYGRSYVAVRIQNGTKAENYKAIADGARVKVEYIGLATLAELGVTSIGTNSGTYFRKYIDAQIASGISEVAAPVTDAKGIYTLSGQRVSKATHGLYIVGGRKVLVK